MMPKTHTIDIFADFSEAMKAKLSGLRLKYPGTIRIIPQDTVIEFEISFTGAGAGQRTQVFSTSKQVIEDEYTKGKWAHIADLSYEMVERELLKLDLIAQPRTNTSGGRLRYRVVSRLTLVTSPSASGANLEPPEEKTLWEGDDPASCKEKLGRMSAIDLANGGYQRTDQVLQKDVAGRWIDIPTPSKAVRRSNPVAVPDALAAIKQAAASMQASMQVPIMTATQKKRQRQQAAATRRSVARGASPTMPEMAELLRGTGGPDDYKIDTDLTDAQIEEERKRLAELQRVQAEREKKRRAEAEAARKREEEARRKRERIQRIRETANEPWKKSGNLVEVCRMAWEDAALHEADARGAQVEADLFGGGLDDNLDAGEKWVEAEKAARELLEYAQERLEEAQARREGKGFESVYEEEEEIPDEELNAMANEAVQEFVDEAEFEEAAREHVVKQLQRAEEEDIPPSVPPETGDEAMDELMGLKAPGLVTDPGF